MSDLVVFAFDNENGALEARDALIRMQKQQLCWTRILMAAIIHSFWG